jgi:UDP-N-acetylglucosamine 2-epimerase
VSKLDFLAESTAFSGYSLWWFSKPHILAAENLQLRKISVPTIVSFLYDLAAMVFARIIGLGNSNRTPQGQRVLASSQDVEWRMTLDPATGKRRYANIYLDAVFNGLKERGIDLITTFPIGYSPASLRLAIQRRRAGFAHIPPSRFWTISMWLQGYRIKRRLDKMWKQDISKSVEGLLGGKGSPLYQNVRVAFREYMPEAFKNTLVATRMLRHLRPDTVLLQNEYGDWQKSLVLAASSLGIPTLALQHGIIYAEHPGYSHDPFEFAKDSPYSNRTIPDKLAVYGEFTKDVLCMQCHYPEDMIELTGQPRYDSLLKVIDGFNKSDFLTSRGVPPSDRVLLLITQGREVSLHFLESVLEAVSRMPNISVLVKPHPGDRAFGWHREVANRYDLNCVILGPKSDTAQALAASDAVATVTSTTAVEAMILRKPVVIVNLTGAKDPIPYVERGAALVARSHSEIAGVISQAMYDEETVSRLKKGMKAFLEYYVRDVGRATQNAVLLVEKMIEEREEE